MLLEECLSNELLDLRNKAAQAIGPLFEKYIPLETPETCTIISTYTHKLLSNHMMERIGYSLALGSLPPSFMHSYIQQILKSLLGCTKITRPTIKWAESRRDAVIAITKIWTKLISIPCILYILNYNIHFFFLIIQYFNFLN